MKLANRRNYYRLLYVQHDAPTEIIRASYRTMMQKLKWHPDLGGEVETAILLNKANATLIDPQKRVEYDKKMRATKNSIYVYRSAHQGYTGPAYCPFCQVRAPGETLQGYAVTDCRVCESPLLPVTKISQQGKSKRAVKRTLVRGQVHFLSRWPQSKVQIGEVQNLSPMGIKFLYDHKLPLNSLIKIDSQGLRSIGRVVSCICLVDQQLIGYSISAEFITFSFEKSGGAFFSERV